MFICPIFTHYFWVFVLFLILQSVYLGVFYKKNDIKLKYNLKHNFIVLAARSPLNKPSSGYMFNTNSLQSD